MQISSGKIIRIDGDRATVSVARSVACKRCAAGRGCGAGLFGAGKSPAIIDIDIPDGCTPQTGDTVEIALQPRNLLHAAGLAYGVPLIVMLGVIALLGWLRGPLADGQAVVIAIIGLAAGMAVAAYRLRHDPCLRRFEPTLRMQPSADAS